MSLELSVQRTSRTSRYNEIHIANCASWLWRNLYARSLYSGVCPFRVFAACLTRCDRQRLSQCHCSSSSSNPAATAACSAAVMQAKSCALPKVHASALGGTRGRYSGSLCTPAHFLGTRKTGVWLGGRNVAGIGGGWVWSLVGEGCRAVRNHKGLKQARAHLLDNASFGSVLGGAWEGLLTNLLLSCSVCAIEYVCTSDYASAYTQWTRIHALRLLRRPPQRVSSASNCTSSHLAHPTIYREPLSMDQLNLFLTLQAAEMRAIATDNKRYVLLGSGSYFTEGLHMQRFTPQRLNQWAQPIHWVLWEIDLRFITYIVW